MTKLLPNSSRVHLEKWNRDFARNIPAGSLVLDAGSGDQPYRRLLAHTQYETADFERVDKGYLPSTYVCDLTSIPVENERFDYLICNQVLEHLPDPVTALQELRRTLKPGGLMLFSMPLFYEEHEQPHDYYRYTQFGHRLMFKKAGLEILSIDWLEGYLGTVAYQMETAAKYLPLSPAALGGGLVGWIAVPFIAAIKITSFAAAALLYRLDIRHRWTGSGFPKNYVVTARKPIEQNT